MSFAKKRNPPGFPKGGVSGASRALLDNVRTSTGETNGRSRYSSRNVRHEVPVGCLSPRRQLVYQLGPFVFDHRAHLVGDDRDLLNVKHVVMQPSQVRWRHNLATDDTRRVGALVPHSWAGVAPGLGR